MNTNFTQQINAIQTARKGAALIVSEASIQEFDSALNDAASTIAALNLTKDLPKPADQSREEYSDHLFELVEDWVEASNLKEEQELENQILAMSYDKIRELEAKAEHWERLYKKAFPSL